MPHIKNLLKMRVYITVCLLFFMLQAQAQDYKQSVKSVMNTYGDLLDKGEIDKSLDYVYPAIFEIVPKEQMATLFKSLFNSKDFKVKLNGFKVDSVGSKKVVEGKQYVTVYYQSRMLMNLTSLDTLSKDKLQATVGMMQLAFANKFGSDNVKYIEETRTFDINSQKKGLAIAPNGSSDWKIMTIESEQKVMMEKLLPKEIRSQFY